jgi:NADH-quinone oxidoreductase subunit A
VEAETIVLASGVGIDGGASLFNDWLSFAIYGFFALMIPTTMIVGSFVFAQRPSRRTRARTVPFESGVSEGPPQRQRFTVSFYLTAMLFILFDIEFLTFLIILLVAYVYIWRKGALEWH